MKTPHERVPKIRLDLRLVELNLAESRHKAQALIGAAAVLVNGSLVTKPDCLVAAADVIALKQKEKFVSRGGIKLDGALNFFNVDCVGREALDVGASTGGFTDCLLQRGAARVTAVDVGYGQIAASLRNDPRVTLVERTNARYLKPSDFSSLFDMATIDVSFISLEKILPAVGPLLKPGGEIVALIKPQFEAGAGQTKKGVVRDAEVHRAVVARVEEFLRLCGCDVVGVTPSPIQGPKGNTEFFVYARRGVEWPG